MEASHANLGSGWKAYFYDQPRAQNWNLQAPLFKQCKKKKEFYSDTFENLWYKHPYKYDMLLRASNIDDNVLAHIKLLYADTLDIVKPLNSKPTITKNENFFHPTQNENEQEVHVGPFQFQVCSYKLDNRDVCLGVYLMLPPELGSVESKVVSILVSPRFTIRSKKPVQQKNKRKRKLEEACDLSVEIPPGKKLKLEDASVNDIMSQQFDHTDAFSSLASLFQSSQQPHTTQQVSQEAYSIPNSFMQYNSEPTFSSLGTTERKQRLAEIIGLCTSEEREFMKKKLEEIDSAFMSLGPLKANLGFSQQNETQPQQLQTHHNLNYNHLSSMPPLPSPQSPSVNDNMGFFDLRPAAEDINVSDYFKEF